MVNKPTKTISDLFYDLPLRSLRSKQIIFFAGDPITHVFYIKSGYVRMYNITNKGNERTLMIFGPGESVPLIQTANAQYFYDAFTNVELTYGSYETLIDRFFESKEYVDIARESGNKLMERIIEHLEVIAYESASEKVEGMLGILGKYNGELRDKAIRLKVKITHQDIANLVNLTRETVTKIMITLHDKKMIDNDSDGYILLKSKMLSSNSILSKPILKEHLTKAS